MLVGAFTKLAVLSWRQRMISATCPDAIVSNIIRRHRRSDDLLFSVFGRFMGSWNDRA
jgi:hypothetical protein